MPHMCRTVANFTHIKHHLQTFILRQIVLMQYIIDQFIKPKPNNRTDELGDSIENRCRIVLEVVEALVQAVGAHRVGIR